MFKPRSLGSFSLNSNSIGFFWKTRNKPSEFHSDVLREKQDRKKRGRKGPRNPLELCFPNGVLLPGFWKAQHEASLWDLELQGSFPLGSGYLAGMGWSRGTLAQAGMRMRLPLNSFKSIKPVPALPWNSGNLKLGSAGLRAGAKGIYGFTPSSRDPNNSSFRWNFALVFVSLSSDTE